MIYPHSIPKLQRLVHTLLFLVPYVRNRLRCPNCEAVGTFKPHGGVFDRQDVRRVPRWLCKWCGYYFGPEGTKQAVLACDILPDRPKGYRWELVQDVSARGGIHTGTPQEILTSDTNGTVHPWIG